MVKGKRRLIAFILGVIMIASTIPVSAFGAADEVKYIIKKPDVGVMNRINSENDLFRRSEKYGSKFQPGI